MAAPPTPKPTWSPVDITLTAVFTTAGGSLDGIRRGDAVIRVVDGGGDPVAGVDVQIDMTQIDFGFGTAIAAGALDNPGYANWIRNNYNWAVAENASKWPSNEPVQGAVSYANADRIWDFAQANDIRMRGHCVFWAVPDFVQQWVKDLDDTGLQGRHRRAHRRHGGALRRQVRALGRQQRDAARLVFRGPAGRRHPPLHVQRGQGGRSARC